MLQVLASIGQLEFFYDQAPDVMRSCSMALQLLSVCIGSYLSGALVAAISSLSYRMGCNWLPQDLNYGRLDLFFLLLAGEHARLLHAPTQMKLPHSDHETALYGSHVLSGEDPLHAQHCWSSLVYAKSSHAIEQSLWLEHGIVLLQICTSLTPCTMAATSATRMAQVAASHSAVLSEHSDLQGHADVSSHWDCFLLPACASVV